MINTIRNPWLRRPLLVLAVTIVLPCALVIGLITYMTEALDKACCVILVDHLGPDFWSAWAGPRDG